MVTDAKEKTKAIWSEDGQVFFTDGYGWGLTKELETICLGKEEDIKSYFETGEMAKELNPLQRQVLADIAEYRKELLSGESGADIKRPGAIRSRPARTVKCRTANLKHSTLRKRIAIH